MRTFLQRHARFNFYMLFLIVVFTALAYFAKSYPYFNFDLVVTKQIQSIDQPFFSSTMRLLSDIGETEVFLPFAGFLMIFLYFKKRRLEAIFLLFSIVLTSVLTVLFKAYVGRSRPDPEIIVYQYHEFLKADSFPSGHVLIFVGVFGFLFYLIYTQFPKSLIKNLFLGFLTSILLLIGVSRIYLGAHWFSDVVGAYLLGLIILNITTLVFRSFKDKDETA